MTDKTISLDQHRGMASQKATELRRVLAEVEANEKALRLRQDELEFQMASAPSLNWCDPYSAHRLGSVIGTPHPSCSHSLSSAARWP